MLLLHQVLSTLQNIYFYQGQKLILLISKEYFYYLPFTAIHWAAFSGHAQILTALIDNGGKAIVLKDANPLLLATRHGKLECAQILVNTGVNVNCFDIAGRSPLHLASWFGYTEIAKLLVNARATVDHQDSSGRTPLHCCCWFGNRGVEQILIEKGAHVDMQDKGGDTPLHFACAHSYAEIVGDLLKAGADCKIKNELDKTPEEVAELEDRGEIIELLQKREDNNESKAGFALLDKNFMHEQRQMSKTVEEMINSQEKTLETLKLMNQRVMLQGDTIWNLRGQQTEMRRLLNEMKSLCKQISDGVNAIVPKNASKCRFDISRVSLSK